MSLTVLHVLDSTRADHGGTSRSVPALCEALDEENVEVHLVTAGSAKGSGDQRAILPDGSVNTRLIEDVRLRRPWAFYQQICSVVRSAQPDVIHDHGVWLSSNIVSGWVSYWRGIPLISTPRGMLTDWALSHHTEKKQFAWTLYQKRILEQATLFHATARAEAESLRALGLSQPTAIIPNGVQVPQSIPTAPDTREKRTLFLSRLHPQKGLPMLLDAWARVQPDGWSLELVGPSEDGHRADLRRQTTSLGICDTVRFSGPVEDDKKWEKYAKADLFVLPSYSENFGIVVAEALAAGVPVITTTGAPWKELDTHNCGWWVAPEVGTIAEALETATALDDDIRQNMGLRGRALVEEKYTWSAVGERMKKAYQWIVGDSDQPTFIEYTSEA